MLNISCIVSLYPVIPHDTNTTIRFPAIVGKSIFASPPFSSPPHPSPLSPKLPHTPTFSAYRALRHVRKLDALAAQLGPGAHQHVESDVGVRIAHAVGGTRKVVCVAAADLDCSVRRVAGAVGAVVGGDFDDGGEAEEEDGWEDGLHHGE
jgi:hypothetical protein